MTDQLLRQSQKVVNVFGAIAYTLLIFVYAVIALASLLWLLNSGFLIFADNPPVPPPESTATDPSGAPSVLTSAVSYIVMGFMAVTAIFVLITLPYWLGKFGSRVLKRVIRMCQITVTPYTLLVAKLIACGLATVLPLIYAMSAEGGMSVVIAILAVITVVLVIFLLQHALAKMGRFEAKNIW